MYVTRYIECVYKVGSEAVIETVYIKCLVCGSSLQIFGRALADNSVAITSLAAFLRLKVSEGAL